MSQFETHYRNASQARRLLERIDISVPGRTRARARAPNGTPAFEGSAGGRREVEMAFAHLKRNLGFLRLRRITGATDEFLLAATVQNLRKLARFRAYRPPIPSNCPAG
jgi:hypothetical protein